MDKINSDEHLYHGTDYKHCLGFRRYLWTKSVFLKPGPHTRRVSTCFVFRPCRFCTKRTTVRHVDALQTDGKKILRPVKQIPPGSFYRRFHHGFSMTEKCYVPKLQHQFSVRFLTCHPICTNFWQGTKMLWIFGTPSDNKNRPLFLSSASALMVTNRARFFVTRFDVQTFVDSGYYAFTVLEPRTRMGV